MKKIKKKIMLLLCGITMTSIMLSCSSGSTSNTSNSNSNTSTNGNSNGNTSDNNSNTTNTDSLQSSDSSQAYTNDYIIANNFFTWETSENYDVNEKLIIKYTDQEVDVTGTRKYNLNTNITVKEGYSINWYSKFNDSSSIIVTQQDYLDYGNNVYYVTITNSGGQFMASYAINIYVKSEFYTYTYYEYQPGYELADQMSVYQTQKIEEEKIATPISVTNGYTFKGWVTYNSQAERYETFDFSQPVTSNKVFYATYEDITLDLGDGLNTNITYSPYLTTKINNIKYPSSTNDRLFDGWYSNDVQYFNELGEATKPLPYSAISNLQDGHSTFTQERYFEFTKIDNQNAYSIRLKEKPAYTTIIKVPETYNNLPITSVEASAFFNFNTITSIIIPNSVTTIGQNAFQGCTSLQGLTLPFIEKYLSYYFGGSSYEDNSTYVPNSLREITISRENISANAFYNCSSLTSINLLNDVTSIGQNAFQGCISLQSLILPFIETYLSYYFGGSSYNDNPAYVPNSLKEITIARGNISANAFYDCGSLTSINLLNDVTSIGQNAFQGCTSLQKLTLPFIDTYISHYFGGSSYKDNRTYIPNSLKEITITRGNISAYTFYDCSSLTSIEILNNVTSIGNYAFYYCTNLQTVTFESGSKLNSIGDYAFRDCTSFTSIEIPNSVTCIGSYAFYNCTKLQTVTFESGSKLNSIGSYAFYECSSLTSIVIPNSVTSIGYDAFRGCSSLTSITIPNSVTSIGSSAFENCSFLTSIVIPNSVTSIGESAFSYCSSLTSIVIPNSVTSIGRNAFYGCSSLTTIEIPNSVTSIGYGAFNDCSSLQYNEYGNCLYLGNQENPYYALIKVKDTKVTDVTINQNAKLIADRAFYGCSSLTSIVIPNSVTSIGDYAFQNCSSLTSIVIPNSVTSIGSAAFYECSSLQYNEYGNCLYLGNKDNPYLVLIKAKNTNVSSVTINENTIHIYYDAFYRCTSLTSIEIPNGVTSIGRNAFSDCSSLTSIVIPNSVTSIGDYAFYGCTNLQTVTFESGSKLNSIGDYAFYECSSLTSIVIPNSVTSIGDRAFYGCTNLQTVTFENGSKLNSIGASAFWKCSSLTSIVIPNSVTSIGASAFVYCSSLTIYCEAETQPNGWDSSWNPSNCPVVWGYKG